jgi:Mrp family chromosome partitioning ATPase
LRALEREAKTERDLLESYLVKYREATARDSINAAPPEARIISRATPALQPAYPKKLPSVLIVAFAGFALSSGFIVTGALLGSPAGEAVAPAAYPYGAYAPAAYAGPGYDPRVSMAPPVLAPDTPLMPRVAAPPLTPAMTAGFAAQPSIVPLPVSNIDQIARNLRQGGEAGRRVTVVGAARNVGTTYAAISLARTLAREANVVLVDLAFGAPNLSVVSTDANAPGIAELVAGAASFGDVITRDQYSNVHLIATGNVGGNAMTLAASPMLPAIVEALGQSYEHVVLDIGAASEVQVERFASMAQRAVLVAADPANPGTRAVRERLMHAGIIDVMLLAGVQQPVAA